MVPKHIAFIPDGNRRRARRDGISIEDAYFLAAEKGVEVVDWCHELGVEHVSAFGASHENVTIRSVEQILAMFGGVLQFCHEVTKITSATLHVFGDVKGISATIPSDWKQQLLEFQRCGRPEGKFVVHLGINYSASTDLAALASNARRNAQDVMAVDFHDLLLSAGVPDVELLVRTGGMQRLSGFLPHQLRYAELYFCQGLWSDFSKYELEQALEWFVQQKRTFGE